MPEGYADSGIIPESTKRRRRLYEAMMLRGTDTSPVGHWTQGAARVMNAMVGGYGMYRADQQDREENRRLGDQLATAFGVRPPSARTSTAVTPAPVDRPAAVDRPAPVQRPQPTVTPGSGDGRVDRMIGNLEEPDRWRGFTADLTAAGVAIDPNQTGGYANRNIRGTNIPSQHSRGRAMDINWTANPEGQTNANTPLPYDMYGEGAREPTNVIHPDIARDLSRRHGLRWGGDFRGRSPDPMHFEIAGAPPVARRGITDVAGVPRPAATPAAAPPPEDSPFTPRESAIVGALLANQQTRNAGIALATKIMGRNEKDPLVQAQIRYYDARTAATRQNADTRQMDANTRRTALDMDQFIERFSNPNVTEAEWNQENREGGLIHAVVGRMVPYADRGNIVTEVQARRRNLGNEAQPTPEELSAAGITPEMQAAQRRQQTIDRFYGGAPRNYRRRADGSVEVEPGYGTATERQGETTARQGLDMLNEAERLLNSTNWLEQLAGDQWNRRPDGTGGIGGFGEAGRGFRASRGAILNLVFALSGKQVSNAERAQFLDIYAPSSLDSRETQKWKLDRVRAFFQQVIQARRAGATDEQVREMMMEESERGRAGPNPQSRPPPRGAGGGREDPLGIR